MSVFRCAGCNQVIDGDFKGCNEGEICDSCFSNAREKGFFVSKRLTDLMAALDFIASCNIEEAEILFSDLLRVHSFYAFDQDNKCLKEVVFMGINGSAIQLNLERWGKND